VVSNRVISGDALSISEKAKEFDPDGEIRREMDNALELLRQFRRKYPFKDDTESIDKLRPEDIFMKGEDYFFRWIEFKLRPLGRIALGSAIVYRNACDQLEDFKDLLRITIDDGKSLAEKVDSPWERISGMGGDKLIAKKIITCYNDNVLPIFRTADLEHFFNLLVGRQKFPSNYDNMSLGEKFQFLTQALLNIKDSFTETKEWDNAYFMRFLYEMFPPSREKIQWGKPAPAPQPLNKLGLLFEPQTHEEMIFLFSKTHEKIGFPYVTKIQAAYPDVFALDNDRTMKRIEIETFASQFDHDPKGCDFIVCWENDLETVPEDWPEIIQLKDYL
jgi:hypothetical protein